MKAKWLWPPPNLQIHGLSPLWPGANCCFIGDDGEGADLEAGAQLGKDSLMWLEGEGVRDL